ncbi:MAG: magnesium transporter [Clostridium sp.]|nr:magnesium transporter [Clostridium sp.]
MDKNQLRDLLSERKYRVVRDILNKMNAVDIEELLEELDDKELARGFRLISKDKAADVFSKMNASMQSYLVDIFTETELKDLLDKLFLDDTVDLLEDLPANLVTRILETVEPEKRVQINRLFSYPAKSAGSVMTPEFVGLKKYQTVQEAMAHIKETGIRSETIYTCYVLEHRNLIGIVSAKNLMTSDDDVLIGQIMDCDIISVTTQTNQEEAARLIKKYDFLALPVLDSTGLMVGIVTFDDVMKVMESETTEDIALMGAVTPSQKPYFDTGVFRHASNRIVWLLVLMVSATFTGAIINHYQAAILAVPQLVSFLPMLMDTGGNCGSQSSTLVIRGLALEEIRFRDFFRVIWKEFRIAMLVSMVLALANGIRIVLIYKDVLLALVVGMSLVVTIFIAKLIGCILPMVAQKIRLDPAIMAAPLITTVVDACSVLVYFMFSTWVFHLAL